MIDKKIICEICGKSFKQVTDMHLKLHSMNVDSYKRRFPGYLLVSMTTSRRRSEPHLGNQYSLGHKASLEFRLAQSIRSRGNRFASYKHTPEFVERRISPLRGRKQSPEVVARRAEAQRGNTWGRGKRSKEFSENQSRRLVRDIMRGSFNPNSRGISGYHYSLKTGCEVYYQSSYELRAFQILDVDDRVEYYIPQPLRIEFNGSTSKRNYIPDILVFMVDGVMRLIEVKAKWEVEKSYNRMKFEAAESYCNDNNLIFEIWTEDKLWESR